MKGRGGSRAHELFQKRYIYSAHAYLRLINASREGLKLEEGDIEKKREEQYKEMFKPLIDFTKEALGKKVHALKIQ